MSEMVEMPVNGKCEHAILCNEGTHTNHCCGVKNVEWIERGKCYCNYCIIQTLEFCAVAWIELCICICNYTVSLIFFFSCENMKSGLSASKIRTQSIHSLLGRRGAIFALLQFVSIGNESIFYIVTCPPIRYAFSNLFQGKTGCWCKLSPRWDQSTGATSVHVYVLLTNATALSLECEQWLLSLLCDKQGRFSSVLKATPQYSTQSMTAQNNVIVTHLGKLWLRLMRWFVHSCGYVSALKRENYAKLVNHTKCQSKSLQRVCRCLFQEE